MDSLKIVDSTPENIKEFGMCGYKNPKMEGYRKKIEWIKERYKEGLKYKVLFSETRGAVGAIEYIPGEFAWRPVSAKNYMFIHCIFLLPKDIKGKGYGQQLLNACIIDAKNKNMLGLAVVTRKGTWMASKDLFIKNGFEIADTAKPDFDLLYLAFNKESEKPSFNRNWEKNTSKYSKGLFLISSHQCPFTAKSIIEISETIQNEYKMNFELVELRNSEEAQNSPGAFGTFCIVYNGEIIADNPVSNTRFKNIMNKVLVGELSR